MRFFEMFTVVCLVSILLIVGKDSIDKRVGSVDFPLIENSDSSPPLVNVSYQVDGSEVEYEELKPNNDDFSFLKVEIENLKKRVELLENDRNNNMQPVESKPTKNDTVVYTENSIVVDESRGETLLSVAGIPVESTECFEYNPAPVTINRKSRNPTESGTVRNSRILNSVRNISSRPFCVIGTNGNRICK